MINGTDTQKLRDVIDDFWMQATGAPYAPADVANRFLERMEDAFYESANRFEDFQLDVELKGGNYEISAKGQFYDPDVEAVFYKDDLKNLADCIRGGVEELEACIQREDDAGVLYPDTAKRLRSVISELEHAERELD